MNATLNKLILFMLCASFSTAKALFIGDRIDECFFKDKRLPVIALKNPRDKRFAGCRLYFEWGTLKFGKNGGERKLKRPLEYSDLGTYVKFVNNGRPVFHSCLRFKVGVLVNAEALPTLEELRVASVEPISRRDMFKEFGTRRGLPAYRFETLLPLMRPHPEPIEVGITHLVLGNPRPEIVRERVPSLETAIWGGLLESGFGEERIRFTFCGFGSHEHALLRDLPTDYRVIARGENADMLGRMLGCYPRMLTVARLKPVMARPWQLMKFGGFPPL